FRYRVAYGCGVQPLESAFVTFFDSPPQAAAVEENVLATLDTQAAAQACGIDYNAPPADENSFTVTLRVQVLDDRGNISEARRTVFLHHDADLATGAPIKLRGSGDSSPLIAQLTPDGPPVILTPTSDGLVYAFRSDGSLLPGWPVHTDALPIHNSAA